MGRTVLWPDLPLNTSWLHPEGGGGPSRILPQQALEKWLCYGPSWEDQMCTYLHLLTGRGGGGGGISNCPC